MSNLGARLRIRSMTMQRVCDVLIVALVVALIALWMWFGVRLSLWFQGLF